MTKEKVVSLEKYLQDLNNRLTSDIPAKQQNRVASYHAYLRNEIRMVTNTLTKAKELIAK